jgi:ADP-ribosylglycohydrolase
MKDRIRGAIVGVAIGDALGMPVESLSPKTIKQYFKWINSYRTPNPRTRTWHKLKRGQWTDDTQLTLAIGDSIVRKKGIDFNDIAAAHVEAFSRGRRGWGKATINGCQKILSGANWWDAGDPKAAGNGPPMKIAPIGVLYGLGVINKPEMINACVNISKMTHGDPRAITAAILQAHLTGKAIRCIGPVHFQHELKEIRHLCDHIEGTEHMDTKTFENSLTLQLYRMVDCADSKDSLIRDILGTRAFVNESVPFTYAMIIKYCDDLKKCMEHIVNQGGDADTTGAMAGSLLGGLYGYSKFPDQWRWRLEDRARLVKLADDLYQLSK